MREGVIGHRVAAGQNQPGCLGFGLRHVAPDLEEHAAHVEAGEDLEDLRGEARRRTVVERQQHGLVGKAQASDLILVVAPGERAAAPLPGAERVELGRVRRQERVGRDLTPQEREVVVPGLAPVGHAARRQPAEELLHLGVVAGLDPRQHGAILIGTRRRRQLHQLVAKGELVGVVQGGVVLQLVEEPGLCRRIARHPRSERVQPVMVVPRPAARRPSSPCRPARCRRPGGARLSAIVRDHGVHRGDDVHGRGGRQDRRRRRDDADADLARHQDQAGTDRETGEPPANDERRHLDGRTILLDVERRSVKFQLDLPLGRPRDRLEHMLADRRDPGVRRHPVHRPSHGSASGERPQRRPLELRRSAGIELEAGALGRVDDLKRRG